MSHYKTLLLKDLVTHFDKIVEDDIRLDKNQATKCIENIHKVVDQKTDYQVASLVPVPMNASVYIWAVTLIKKEKTVSPAKRKSSSTPSRSKKSIPKKKTSTKPKNNTTTAATITKATKDEGDLVDDLKDNE